MKRILIYTLLGLSLLFLSACVNEDQIIEIAPPTISGQTDIFYVIGDEIPNYLDNILAYDHKAFNLTNLITVDDSGVDLSQADTYELFYEVIDLLGNRTQEKIYVYVLPKPLEHDEIAPIISGTKDYIYHMGDPIIDFSYGVTAFDAKDGVLTHEITIDSSAVNYEVIGIYQVIYQVSDQAGNQNVTFITVEVKQALVQVINQLKIYYINDFHGAILNKDSQMGISKIGSLILDEKQNNPDQTLFLSGGDILQGSLLSNYFLGASTIDLLNLLQLDTFVMGNHEFDWGIDTVTNYFNPNAEQSVLANYPLLGANIFYKNTTIRPDFIDPYQIIEKGNIKIGIIGAMGFNLESSIATSRVEDYEFADPIYWIGHYADILKVEEKVDIVIAIIHGASDYTNQAIGNLSGTKKIDVLFNGHLHRAQITSHSRSGVNMPIIQSGANGTHVGYVEVNINDNKEITSIYAINKTSSNDARLKSPHPLVDDLIDYYYTQISDLINDEIIKSGSSYSRDDLTLYMSEVIRISGEADIGFHNRGGTRSSLSYQQPITVATLYDIFPFDNKVKTVILKGDVIKDFISSGAAGSEYSMIDGLSLNQISNHLYYKVATNDYVFDDIDNPFIYGDQIIDTGILIRDVLENIMRNQAKNHAYFYTSGIIDINKNNMFYPTDLKPYDLIKKQFMIDQ